MVYQSKVLFQAKDEKTNQIYNCIHVEQKGESTIWWVYIFRNGLSWGTIRKWDSSRLKMID